MALSSASVAPLSAAMVADVAKAVAGVALVFRSALRHRDAGSLDRFAEEVAECFLGVVRAIIRR
jgi:Flp pilus assembly protein TadB